MKKIPTLYVRDYDTTLVKDEITPGCEWVLAGEGVATRKLDGTACMIKAGRMFKRRMVKPNTREPKGFIAAGPPDEHTGKVFGWVPVGEGPEDATHREAFYALKAAGLHADGTYELLGPKVQGNQEGVSTHRLMAHENPVLVYPLGQAPPRSFEEIKHWLACRNIEGVVWHHPDGRRAKIKKRDYGLRRQP